LQKSVSVLDVTVTVERVECSRLAEGANENSKSIYKLDASMSEKERSRDSLTVSFTLELTGQPKLAKFTVAGTARVKGSGEDIKRGTAAKDDKTPPDVLGLVYERVYGLLYLLAGTLKVPHPLPNLLKSSE
jgi:hypothetical protein